MMVTARLGQRHNEVDFTNEQHSPGMGFALVWDLVLGVYSFDFAAPLGCVAQPGSWLLALRGRSLERVRLLTVPVLMMMAREQFPQCG